MDGKMQRYFKLPGKLFDSYEKDVEIVKKTISKTKKFKKTNR